MKFDLNEVLAFERVASLGSFTLAADFLNQPKGTISRKLKSLEVRLGIRLIDRTTRSLRLTEAGDRYYLHCQKMYQSILDAEYSKLDSTQELSISICTNTFIANFIEITNRYIKQNPNIDIQFNDYLSNDAIPVNTDIIVSSSVLGEEWESITFEQSNYVFCCSAAYYECKNSPVNLQTLNRYPLLLGIGEETWLRKEGLIFSSSNIIRCNIDFRLKCCIASMGVALLPKSSIKQQLENKEIIELSVNFKLLKCVTYLSYRRKEKASDTVKSLLRLLST